jgi:hypothetical protein
MSRPFYSLWLMAGLWFLLQELVFPASAARSQHQRRAANRPQVKGFWGEALWRFLFWFNAAACSVAAGVVLALRPMANAPAAAFLLRVAANLGIWGWHRKTLGAKEIATAMLGFVVAGSATMLLGLASASGSTAAILQNFRVWSRSLNLVPVTLMQYVVINKIVFAVALADPGAVLMPMQRQPPHLWSVLGHTLVYGGVAIGGLSILPLAILLAAGS